MITEDIKIIEGLCLHCGICAEICPSNAITLFEQKNGLVSPRIDYSKCHNCGLCHKICPSEPLRFNECIQVDHKDRNRLLSPYKQCFLSYMRDVSLRYKGSSAGVTKGLITHCLKNKKVSAVISVVENDSEPLKPHFAIIRDLKDYPTIANSKYCPVSFNGVIKELIADNSLESILFTGLPCHIRAIKKIFKNIPALKGREIFTIGLFCKKTKDLRYVKYLKNNLIKKTIGKGKVEIEAIQFRGDGWPGKINIKSNGSKYELDHMSPVSIFTWHWGIFSPYSCLFCYDAFARDADLSIGDPWLKKYVNNKEYSKGASFVIVRSQNGQDLFDSCCDGIIKNKVDSEEVVESQSVEEIQSKIVNGPARMKILSLFFNRMNGLTNKQKISPIGLINSCWFLPFKYIFESIFQNKFFCRMNPFFFKVLMRFPSEIIKNKHKKIFILKDGC